MPEIDPAFLASSHALDELPLCHVRLQDDARWPWLILIPQVAGAREIEDLTVAERRLLVEEVVAAGMAAARPALAPGAQPYPPFPGRGPA